MPAIVRVMPLLPATAPIIPVGVQPKSRALGQMICIGLAVGLMLAAIPVSLLLTPLPELTPEIAPVPEQAGVVKTPAGTWREYASVFREYSTSSVPPELLAALAQVESGGNPVARPYKKHAVGPYYAVRPASSATGMFQMTDAAFAYAQGHCIRDHQVVAARSSDTCRPHGTSARTDPAPSTELTASLLHRNISAILSKRKQAASPKQKQDLAAIIHLCGPTRAVAFAKRGFRLAPGERCGEHSPAAYLKQVETMRRQFVKYAEES